MINEMKPHHFYTSIGLKPTSSFGEQSDMVSWCRDRYGEKKDPRIMFDRTEQSEPILMLVSTAEHVMTL